MTASNPHGIQVGQVVYRAWRDRRKNTEGLESLTVLKVGRKWAEFNSWGGRFDMATLVVDGWGSPDSDVYVSPAQYEAKIQKDEAWSSLRRQVFDRHKAPAHLTTEEIQAMERAICGRS